MPEDFLNLWRFDHDDWRLNPDKAPLRIRNVVRVEGWSGHAVQLSGPNPALLVLPATTPTGRVNLLPSGTIRFWFRPHWDSATGSEHDLEQPRTLLEVGAWEQQIGMGTHTLGITPDGGSLFFALTGGDAPILETPISWAAGEWHQVALGYSPEGTVLYLDGVLSAIGLGVDFAPLEAVHANWGVALGSDVQGGFLAQGEFDELTTFAAPLDPESAAANYLALAERADMGSISAEESFFNQSVLAAATAAASAYSLNPEAQGQAASSINCENGPALIPELIRNQQTMQPEAVRLTFCGRAPQTTYELAFAPSLSPPVYWQRIAFIPPEQTEYIHYDLRARSGFYRFGKLPDYYVSASAPVTGDGSMDLPFQTLQEALDQAPDGTVIRVLPGVYSGEDNVDLVFGAKSLVLVSERGWEQTTIDCQQANHAFIFANSQSNKVIGFTLANALNTAVLSLPGSHAVFMNCSFVGNTGGQGGAIGVNQGHVSLLNCRFRNNTATQAGSAIHALGAPTSWGAVVALQCTFSENPRPSDSGTVHAAANSRVELVNTIVWTSTDLGAEIALSGTGSAKVEYCNIRGGFAGTGNLSLDPQFEPGESLRLSGISPCIDRGIVGHHLGEYWVTDYDMDGEARLDHDIFPNTYSTTDIGADECVYRIQFPTTTQMVWLTNSAAGGFTQVERVVSKVDEASGVTFMGSTPTGPLIAVVDDEDRTGFRIFQLNADASAVVSTTPVSTLNTAYQDLGDQEIADMEGVTFDAATSQLFIVTSQTKRNRFRNVDASPPILDPISDPPSSDYDRRRAVLVRLQMNPAIPTSVQTTTHFESEYVPIPYNHNHAPAAGLAAFLRAQLSGNPALVAQNFGTSVLIAVNDQPKFGTPINGQSYPGEAFLPYLQGGPEATEGRSLGTFPVTGNTTVPDFQLDSINYFKVWAVDANLNYYPGPLTVATNNGLPNILINEFEVAGDNETIEFYNPSTVAVSMAGLWLSDDPSDRMKYQIPAVVIPGRSVMNLVNIDNVPFTFGFKDNGTEDIVLTWSDGATILDRWNMQNPSGSISEGRAWDGGPRGFVGLTVDFESCIYRELTPASPYPPNLGLLNHAGPRKFFDAVADLNQTDVHLSWQGIGDIPPVWDYSPKQHDFHSLNVEDIAFRSPFEMILGLRSPLVNRTNGNAHYFLVTDVDTFLSSPWTTQQPVTGIAGPFEMDLGGLGIRSIKWCPQLGPASVGRYLIVAGTADGGPLSRESPRQVSALFAWDGTSPGNVATPQRLIPNLRPYAIRPEGVDLIQVNGQWRVLFVEDRFQSEGYATRNAIHWPLSILGTID